MNRVLDYFRRGTRARTRERGIDARVLLAPSWLTLGVLFLAGIVWLFFRYTYQGQWTKEAGHAIKHRLQHGEWEE